MSKETTMKVCGFASCKEGATLILTQRVGKKQSLPCCEKHAPKWVKQGGSPFYDVSKVTSS